MPLSLLEKLRDMENRPAPEKLDRTPLPEKQETCFQQDHVEIISDSCMVYDEILEAMPVLFDLTLPEEISVEDILFLDTETTGLSHGAGTVAFLVGIGFIRGNRFTVRQLLMRDYPEEPALLETLAPYFRDFKLLVTFNGKTFDAPLLHDRLLMNRISPHDLDALPHGDLLTAARRVFKLRLGKCNLSRLEEELFHDPRQDDLPGSKVPERYFLYLKTGEFALLSDILRHNRQDIFSLYRLLSHMALMYLHPENVAKADDLFSMGRVFERQRNSESAKRCYRLCQQKFNQSSATFRLGLLNRREADYSAAIAVFDRMIAQRQGGILPYVEAAKICEHHLGDIRRAMDYTQKAIILNAEPGLGADNNAVQSNETMLQYRYQRLLKKLRRIT